MVEKAKKSKASKDQTATDINFKFKSIRTSCSEVIDFTGNKHYRTVFRLNEVETLFVDTEVINKQFDEKAWDAEIVAALIYMHGEQPVLVAQKGGKVTIPETESVFQFSTAFSVEDFTDFRFQEGAYRVQVMKSICWNRMICSGIIFNCWTLGLTNVWRKLLMCSVLTRIRPLQPKDWKTFGSIWWQRIFYRVNGRMNF